MFRFFHFALLLLFLTLPVTARTETINLPDIGDTASGEFSPEEERKLGESLMRWLRQNDLIEKDPIIQSYIYSLGYQLVANSDETSQPYTFFVVKDTSINAFAAPGGFIGIHTGLILISETESELAGVISHEIAHITQKHLIRTMEATKKHRITTAVALLAALLVGQNVDQLAEAAIATTLAANTQLQIDFTRAHEKEADYIGIKILANSGFDPEGMPDFFGRMQKASQLYGNSLPEFLSTHPVTVNRIAESKDRARKIPKHIIKQDARYPLIKARLTIEKETNIKQFIKGYKKTSKKIKNKNIFHYTLALANMKAGLFKQAQKHVNVLVKKNPEHIYFRITEAKILHELKQNRKANEVYIQLMRLYPYSYAITVHYSRFLLATNQYKNAYKTLKNYTQNRKTDIQILKLFSDASSKIGKTTEAYFYLGQYEFENGNTHNAISHLNTALKFKKTDYFLSSKIEAKLKQYKETALQEK
ncbi:MAG: M48 family metallopeptidase [Gammaproteobacteria bacterium]|nr:M48 family metallopeptidase [Gammaproteobacteria bacterium]